MKNIEEKDEYDTNAVFDIDSDGLTEKQRQAVELLELSGLPQYEVAKELGVHRNTVSAWCKKANFKAARRRCAEEKRRQNSKKLEDFFNDKSPEAAQILYDIMIQSKDTRSRIEIAKYLIDRKLGKITTKVEVEDNREDTEDVDIGLLLSRAKNRAVPLTLVDTEKTG